MRSRQRHTHMAARRSFSPGADMRESVASDGRIPVSGIGTIRLDLPKTRYAAGEAIEGTLLLDISRPILARGVFAVLSAQQQFYRRPDLQGNGMRTVTRKVYHYQQQLDGRREYERTAEPTPYPFRLMLPPRVGFLQDVQGPAGGTATAISNLPAIDGSVPSGTPAWSVEGFLDIPLAFDVRETVRLRVGKGRDGQGT
jgi:hypothetical protein